MYFRKSTIYMLCLFFVISLCSCQEEQTEVNVKLNENQVYVYYVNQEKTGVVSGVQTIDKKKTAAENAKELLEELIRVQATEEYQSPIPEGITFLEGIDEVHNGRIEVSFNVVYDVVDAESLLFFKTCVVKTLLQLDGVDSVTLSLTDLANAKEENATISENYDQDSFIMSFGDDSGYRQKGTIILYFANKKGTALKEYRKDIEISNTTSLDRIVMDSLIEGPQEKGFQATLPKDTTIRNISVKDGICYVDLSDEFYNTDNPLKNDIIVYSIVNSLAELPTVSKVQFLKNGEKQSYFRETMPFDGIFERNLDLID